MNPLSAPSISDVLQQAVLLTKKNYLAFLPLILALLIIINYVATTYFSTIDLSNEAGIAQLREKANLVTIITLLLTPIEIGCMLMGVKAARGLSIKTTDILAIFADSAKIIILAIISFILVQLGMLLIIPGLALLVLLSMAQPLMCDYRLSMLESIKQSVTMCYRHASLIIPLYLILSGLIIVSFFTFGIALLLTIPFYVNAKGIVYCALYDNQAAINSASTQ